MMLFRDWADHPLEEGKANSRVLDRRPRIVRHEDGPDTIEHEGPPVPCCAKRRVGADMLIWYGDLPAPLLQRVRDRFPHLASVPTEDLYLCDGCRETLRRERVLLRPEMPNWKNDPTSRRYGEKQAKGQLPP